MLGNRFKPSKTDLNVTKEKSKFKSRTDFLQQKTARRTPEPTQRYNQNNLPGLNKKYQRKRSKHTRQIAGK